MQAIAKKSRHSYNDKEDMATLKYVLATNPYAKRTNWKLVENSFNIEMRCAVTSRSLRDRVDKLLQEWKKKFDTHPGAHENDKDKLLSQVSRIWKAKFARHRKVLQDPHDYQDNVNFYANAMLKNGAAPPGLNSNNNNNNNNNGNSSNNLSSNNLSSSYLNIAKQNRYNEVQRFFLDTVGPTVRESDIAYSLFTEFKDTYGKKLAEINAQQPPLHVPSLPLALQQQQQQQHQQQQHQQQQQQPQPQQLLHHPIVTTATTTVYLDTNGGNNNTNNNNTNNNNTNNKKRPAPHDSDDDGDDDDDEN